MKHETGFYEAETVFSVKRVPFETEDGLRFVKHKVVEATIKHKTSGDVFKIMLTGKGNITDSRDGKRLSEKEAKQELMRMMPEVDILSKMKWQLALEI